jgi:hypothetical protein
MTPTQTAFALVASLSILLTMLELVRRRKVSEEYALLWILTGLSMVALVVYYPALELLGRITGAVMPTTTLFIFAIFFLMLISVHFSIAVSRLTRHVRRLTQELAILSAERQTNGASPSPAAYWTAHAKGK